MSPSPGAVDELFARVDRDLGRLDVLVDNEGISYPEPTVDVTEERWQRMIDIHLGGTFRCSRAAYPLLARHGGAIVNVSSIAAILGAGKRASYSAAKREYRAAPGPRDRVGARRDPGQRRRSGRDRDRDPDREHRAGLLDPATFDARIPLGRIGRAEEIAETVYFLADTATSSRAR